MKEYCSIICVNFWGNNLECESEEEYIKQIKKQYHEEYGLYLTDDEIFVGE